MIQSSDYRFTVSNLGWVDGATLWVYDSERDRSQSAPLGDAKYLSLYSCKNPAFFSVLHHFEGPRIRLSIHDFRDPSRDLCSVERLPGGSIFDGNIELFQHAPRYYVTYFDPGHDGDFYLVAVDSARKELKVDRFDWYDESYDKGYQGITGVIELPSGSLIVSVQRDSHPVLYDPENRKLLRKLSLAGNHGNPRFRMVTQRHELWVDDYDTLLKLDVEELCVKRQRRLQESAKGTAQFIGDWTFNREFSICLVARPFSGDVLAVSADTLSTKYVCSIGKQPLEVGFTSNGNVIARDWKSGVLLKGSLRRKWFG